MMKKGLLKKSAALTLAAAMSVGMAGIPAAAEENDLYGDEVTIKVMLWDRGNAASGTTTEDNTLTQWIQEQVKELYNINVEYVSVPRSESDDKLNIMMTGGTAPDIVFTYDQSIYYNYASSGALYELSDLYATYGSNIAEYCGEAQSIATVEGEQYAVMKQRGTESPRHTAYIRSDWLEQLGMDMPTTKEELGEYLYAVKEAGLGTPWAMSGRTDTEKMYLNFIGSYVTLESDRDAYIYNESYMAVAPGSEDGLRQLNTWYNDGLITQDFPTDTAEDVYKAAVANGEVGFLLDDTTTMWSTFEILNNETGSETFVPINCFELEDGSYRTPYEYRYAMYVMIPQTASEEKAVACMKYLNWLADPEIAVQIRYTPEVTYTDYGAAVELSAEELDEKGYPGTCDDLCIMNLNFSWVNDYDAMAQANYDNQSTEWATLEWYQNYYSTVQEGKYRFPSYAYQSEAEQTYGADVKTRMIEFVYNMICCSSDEFDSKYESGYNELLNAGLQDILDGRAEYYDSVNG